MPNPYVNKVIYGTTVLVDLTEDTVTPSTLMQGYTAHDKSGALITGTNTGGGTEAGTVTQDANGFLVLSDEGGGSSIDVEALSVSQNGTYTAPSGTAYSPVTVNVANSYTSSDEGKVVSNGALVAQTARASSITANGTYDTTTNNSVTVNVSGGGGDTWSWIGRNPVKLQEWTEHISFADLGLAEWTWGTSSTTLRSSQSLSPTFDVDLSEYDLILVTNVRVHYDYANWSPLSAITDYAYAGIQCVVADWTNAAAITSGVPNIRNTETSNLYEFLYNTSAGVSTYNRTAYGIYSSSAATSSPVGTFPNHTMTVYTPPIYARGHNTYYSGTAHGYVDMNESYYECIYTAWKVDAASSRNGHIVKRVRDILSNGLGAS